jgi:membrane-bound metal-dependent hydrolase YbcI (DUF457 family)
MIAGHFGLAAGVKARAPAVPLWALMLASQWLDVVFVPLFLAGVETVQPIARVKTAGYGDAIIHADYTHSLVGAVALSLIFGGLAALRYGRKSGVVLAGVAFSHWILDLVMHRGDMPLHRGDMPLLPASAGGFPQLGFGLWRFPVAAATLELAVVVVGGALYWRTARGVAGTPQQRRRANLCGAAVLVAGMLTLGLNVSGQ